MSEARLQHAIGVCAWEARDRPGMRCIIRPFRPLELPADLHSDLVRSKLKLQQFHGLRDVEGDTHEMIPMFQVNSRSGQRPVLLGRRFGSGASTGIRTATSGCMLPDRDRMHLRGWDRNVDDVFSHGRLRLTVGCMKLQLSNRLCISADKLSNVTA